MNEVNEVISERNEEIKRVLKDYERSEVSPQGLEPKVLSFLRRRKDNWEKIMNQAVRID